MPIRITLYNPNRAHTKYSKLRKVTTRLTISIVYVCGGVSIEHKKAKKLIQKIVPHKLQ